MRRSILVGLLLLAPACATSPAPRPEAQAAVSAPTASATPAKAAPPAPSRKATESATQWTNRGIVHEREGRPDEAERAYREALELQPELQAAWDNLTRLHCRTGRAQQLEAQLRERLQAAPEALAPRTALVLALLCQQKNGPAAAEAKQVLKADERNVKAMQLLAQVYYRERKYELARMVLENARTIAPGEAATANALGLVYLALGLKPTALESFQRAAELRPDYAEARNNLGALLNEAQDYTAAARELEAAVQSAPDFVSARLNLGNAYRGQGDFARALAEYQHVLRLAPLLPDTYFNLAILYLDAEPPELDTLTRLQTALSYFAQYRDKGGRDERVEQYVKDARKGLDREERRLEREKRNQLREAPAPPASSSDRVSSDRK